MPVFCRKRIASLICSLSLRLMRSAKSSAELRKELEALKAQAEALQEQGAVVEEELSQATGEGDGGVGAFGSDHSRRLHREGV